MHGRPTVDEYKLFHLTESCSALDLRLSALRKKTTKFENSYSVAVLTERLIDLKQFGFHLTEIF